MTSILKKLCLGTALTAIAATVFTSDAVASNPVITLAQENTAIAQVSKLHKNTASDPISMVSTNDATLDNALLGTSSLRTGYNTALVNGNFIYMSANVGGLWKTYRNQFIGGGSPMTFPFSTTQTIAFTESASDGGAGAATTLTMLLTAPGSSPGSVTQTAFTSWINGITTTSVPTGVTGTTITSTGTALPTGWTTKLTTSSGSAVTLDPLAGTINWNVSPYSNGANGTAVVYSANFTNAHTWNLAANSTTAVPLNFSLATGGGSAFSINAYPGQFPHGAGATLVAAQNTGPVAALCAYLSNLTNLSTPFPARIFYSATNPGFYNLLSRAITDVRTIVKSGAVISTQAAINTILNATHSPFLATNFVTNASPTQDSSNYSALIAATSANVQNITWSTNGTQVIANGKVGATGALKNFVGDVTTNTMYDSTVGASHLNLLQLQSEKDDDCMYLVSLIANGSGGALDASAAPLSAGDRPKYLALLIANQVSSVASVTAKDLATIVDAASY